MAGFFSILKSSPDPGGKKKDKEEAVDLTPLERMLLRATGTVRSDGSDKFYGLENFGNTCYCNSILQALFHSELFRDALLRYRALTPEAPGRPEGTAHSKIRVTIRPPLNPAALNSPTRQRASSAEVARRRQASLGMHPGPSQSGSRFEDNPDAPDNKKKQAMIKGPVLELRHETADAPNAGDTTLLALQDIFQALIEAESRTGVLSPQRFLDIFKQKNEFFRNSNHQDAHEFYGLVLNDMITTVEANLRRQRAQSAETLSEAGPTEPARAGVADVMSTNRTDGLAMARIAKQTTAATTTTGKGTTTATTTGWVHDLFEGVLVSETRCLACERASQKSETFLDLSIDLEDHTSVTSCLRSFSAEEMLCERNKFHCDHCGGLQEAEKRMKLKRLPKILALHLKRFKYTEDYSRLQKLFHRVVYPYQLRMFNTTDDTEDSDRLYELYAVVIHIGGYALHGHYVAVIKTREWGWLLFDDEMVEPVGQDFVMNFFGDKPGQACAYVLFYQQKTPVAANEEPKSEPDVPPLPTREAEVAAAAVAAADAKVPVQNGHAAIPNGYGAGPHALLPLPLTLTNGVSLEIPSSPAILPHANTAPGELGSATTGGEYGARFPPMPASPPGGLAGIRFDLRIWEDRKRDRKEHDTAEKARKLADKQLKEKTREKGKRTKAAAAEGDENGAPPSCKSAASSTAPVSRDDADVSSHPDSDGSGGSARGVNGGANGAAGEQETAVSASAPLFSPPGFLAKTQRGTRSMGRRSFAFLGKAGRSVDSQQKPPPQQQQQQAESTQNGDASVPPPLTQKPDKAEKEKEKLKDRLTFGLGLGRKKSVSMLSTM